MQLSTRLEYLILVWIVIFISCDVEYLVNYDLNKYIIKHKTELILLKITIHQEMYFNIYNNA